MSTAAVVPSAPSHLSLKAQKEWSASYQKALVQAKNNFPEDESRQRAAAFCAANAMLDVPAPQSAAGIDALEDWQVILRGTRGGNRFCVTSDGKKYSFPIPVAAPKAAPVAEPKPAAKSR